MKEKSPPPANALLAVADEYGDRFQDHLLELYKVYVASAQEVSERRISANNFLLAINASLVTLFGLVATVSTGRAWHLVVVGSGVLVCVTWYVLIQNYRNLNTAKFQVIHELEKHLPAAPFRHEWEIVERGRGMAYTPLSHIERWIPLIFALLYIVLGVGTMLKPASPKPSAVTITPQGVRVDLTNPADSALGVGKH
jgi:hypothetical protein